LSFKKSILNGDQTPPSVSTPGEEKREKRKKMEWTAILPRKNVPNKLDISPNPAVEADRILEVLRNLCNSEPPTTAEMVAALQGVEELLTSDFWSEFSKTFDKMFHNSQVNLLISCKIAAFGQASQEFTRNPTSEDALQLTAQAVAHGKQFLRELQRATALPMKGQS